MLFRAFTVSALLTFIIIGSCTAEPQAVRLLTVGNSFSANATRYLGDLAKAGGQRLIHLSLVLPGGSFQDQVTKARKHEENPKSKAGLYTNGLSLKAALKQDRWDYVTVQQASIKSADFRTYQPYAGELRDYLMKHAPQAKLLVHQTWAYRLDDPRFLTPSGKLGEPQSHEQMYRDLTSAYDRIARELGGTVIPVGDAFYSVDKDPSWGFKHDTRFDRKSAQAPSLPDQTHSLHVGWQWRKQKTGKLALIMDGHHANSVGEYLGSCVWYEVLFGHSVVGNRFIPKGMTPEYALFLQKTAHRTVQARLKKQKSAAATMQDMQGLVASGNFQRTASQVARNQHTLGSTQIIRLGSITSPP